MPIVITRMNDLSMLYAFHVHVILSIFGIFGLILLYHCIVTFLPKETQRTIAVATLIISGIGIALTVPFCLVGMRLMMG